MDCDTYYSSQASTQGCHATQEVGSQQLDQSVCDEDVWGRLLSLRRNVQVYNLIKDNYLFGRGEATYRFTEEFFDTKFLSTLSKLHFRIYREKNSSEEFVVILEDTSFNGTFVNKILIGKNNKKVLRNNDEISLATPHNKDFACNFAFSLCLLRLSRQRRLRIPTLTHHKVYDDKKLGSGTYGEVRLAYADGSLARVAVKIVSKKILSANGTTVRFSNVSQINNEIKLLRSVNHPCIVQLLDLIDSEDKIYIVMELAGGGELFDRISNFGKLKEPIAKIYFYQLVHAVCYLHDKKIVHRDIKPENILLDCDDEYARIKLTDFGLSKLTNDASKMTSLVGTPTYIAPEFLMDEEGRFYNSKVDMWSLGVVLFVCLAGYAPFNGKTDVETRINIKKAKFSMRKPCWSEVSSEAKDLVTKLLVLDPQNRLSAEQVLQHPWLDDPVMMKRAHKLMKLPLQMSPPKRALDEDTIDGAKKSKKKLNGIGSSEAEGSEYPKIMSGLDFESTDEKEVEVRI